MAVWDIEKLLGVGKNEVGVSIFAKAVRPGSVLGLARPSTGGAAIAA